MKVGQIWSQKGLHPGPAIGWRVLEVFGKSASLSGKHGYVWMRPVKKGLAHQFILNDDLTAPAYGGTWTLIEDVP